MTLEEFHYIIDCKFPYHNEVEWKRIIQQSHEIGNDAPFLVLHEICRLPASVKLELTKHMTIYEYWKDSFTNPIQKIIDSACLAHITKQDFEDKKALEIMNVLSEHPKSYSALQIVLFSCPDEDDLVDNKYEEIIRTWNLAT